MTTADLLSEERDQEHVSPEMDSFERHVDHLCLQFKAEFKKITRFYIFFHLSFFLLAVAELFLFLLFFSLLTKTTWLALALAALFMTAFSYFVLLFYFDAKKPEQFFLLRQEFLKGCQEPLKSIHGSSGFYLILAKSLHRLFGHLHQQENHYYPIPKQFDALSQLLQKFSVWCHWKDVHKIKELLLFASIEQHICLIKMNPLDLEAHASLAQTFCILYKHYLDPRKVYPHHPFPWVSSEYFSDEMREKFQTAAERALEEFKILKDYAPGDLWVHAQLASVYRDLARSQEETQEYEIMLKISSQDREILFRLGVLYFQQGANAKALQVYDQLKKLKDKRAEDLITYYDACIPSSIRPLA